MTIVLPALAVAFAAFSVWLVVRIVNRRERWAKWTLAVLLISAISYPLSLGPVCWVSSRIGDDSRFNDNNRIVSAIYAPLFEHSPSIVYKLLFDYSSVMAADEWCWDISSPYDTRLKWGIPYYRIKTIPLTKD